MGITEETRREAYYESRESAPTRRKPVSYTHLTLPTTPYV